MQNNLQTLNERIAERIGKDLVDLIPADEWQKLVNLEVAKFKRETAPKIIQELLSKAYRTEAQLVISELTVTQEWNEITQKYTHQKLKEFIAESGGEIFAGVLSPAMSIVLSDLNNRLNSITPY